jgi:hypothetical protein
MISDVVQKSNGNVTNGQNVSIVTQDSGIQLDAISIYEDAADRETPVITEMENLSESQRLRSLEQILDIFFNNRIKEAESLVEPHIQTCVNHSHVRMYFSAMSAMMTLDPVSFCCCCCFRYDFIDSRKLHQDLMENAKKQIQSHLDFCDKHRPRRGNFATRFFVKEDYSHYTDREMMAELNYAEALFLYAILTFFNGQTIMTLIRAAFKLNSSYNILCFCYDVQKNKSNWSDDHAKYTFDAGVLNAVGFVIERLNVHYYSYIPCSLNQVRESHAEQFAFIHPQVDGDRRTHW